MSEPSTPAVDLDAQLRMYFAATTATELPRSISQMNVRCLRERRGRRLTGWLAGALGVVGVAAVVFVVAAHPGSQGASSSSARFGAAAPAGPDVATPLRGSTVGYPGVDSANLAASGVVLLAPGGHGTVSLSPAQAQAAATRALGGTPGQPGPAVLAFAQLHGGPNAGTCLCWLVDVPITGDPVASSVASHTRTALVLVDAVDGRVVATLTGHGIP